VHVSHLSLSDFRSWPELELALAPGTTALVGANGQGKTNLVEAIGYVATLGSHRVATDAPLVRAGCERAVVRARVEREGRSTLVEIEVNPGRANRARINRGPVPRAREVLGTLRTVLFAPEDLALVRGEPAERRRFLDDLLVASAPRYAGVRADYERVLKQRNALLKTAFLARRSSGGADMRTLDVWDSHLATAGAELLGARLALVTALRPEVARAYREVSDGQGDAELAYRARWARRSTSRRRSRATGRCCWRRCCRSWPGCGRRRWSAGPRWWGRTATSWPWCWAACR
jgi:DNA replication and repair protein RecF